MNEYTDDQKPLPSTTSQRGAVVKNTQGTPNGLCQGSSDDNLQLYPIPLSRFAFAKTSDAWTFFKRLDNAVSISFIATSAV